MATTCKTKQPPLNNSNKCGCNNKPATPVELPCCNNNDNIGNTTNGHNVNGNGNNNDDHVPEEHFSYIKRVGSYLVGRTLGEGSFAKVRLGLHLPTAEKVAIKVLDKHRAANDTYMEMTIRREGRLLRRIRPHPNIVQLYEVMETANSLYLVLELCEGGDFLDLVASRGRLSEPECRMFLRQIIDAVSHLHSFGILHRDLKIENFMLDSTLQQIKIIDLGLSTAAPGGSATRTQCGSPAYAAPELIRSPHYGPEIDVWSIGVDMFAMLTGGLPFTVEPFSIKNLYAKMVAREMNPLPSDTTPEAIDLLHRLLEPDPRLRITLQAALAHPWLRTTRRVRCTVDSKCVFPQPSNIKIINGVKNAPGDPSILDLNVATRAAALAGSSLGSLLRDVAAAVPSNLAATYHLLARHMKRSSSDQNGDNSSHGKQSPQSPMSPVNNGGSNSNNNHYGVVKGHIPHVARRYDPGNTNNNNDMEISYIANNSPKPNSGGGIITNITRVAVANHNSLHRPAKILPPQSPAVALTTAKAVVSGDHHRNHAFLPPTNECRPHSTNLNIVMSASESEPASSGVQTLERRKLRHPRLAPPLNRHHEEEEDALNTNKKSAPDVALSNCSNSTNNNGDTHNGDNNNNNNNNNVKNEVSTSEQVDRIRWAGDGVGTVIPQCFLTSCCGELPLKAVPLTAPGLAPPSTPLQQHRVPSSTPTPPSCMQISHIVTKAGSIQEFCQSHQLSNNRPNSKSSTGKPLLNTGEYVDNSATRKPASVAMFGCMGRDQRRLSSNISDFVFVAKKQSYMPDGFNNSSDTSHHHNSRLISSKTPPPPVSVLTPINNGHNGYLLHHGQNNGHHQITAAALIVKPAVQAVAAAARRVLCGASPQPTIQHVGTLDRHIGRGNNVTNQAAV